MNASLSLNSAGGLSGRLAGLFHKKSFVDVPPSISGAKRFPYGQFQMEISLPRYRDYQVEASSDLRNWTELTSDSARAAKVEYLDPTAANHSYRFYRVRSGGQLSVNVLGYAALIVCPGFSLIANPFYAPDNTVGSLFPQMVEGTALTKFDTHLFKLVKNVFLEGKWSNPSEVLLPGEGAIFFNPTSDFKTLGMVGEVPQGELSIPIPAGFSVRSSMVPLPGQLDVDLLFPAANEDVIHLYDRDRQEYVVYSFNAGKWSPDPPVLAVGESFWVGKTNAGNWNRTVTWNRLEPMQGGSPGA